MTAIERIAVIDESNHINGPIPDSRIDFLVHAFQVMREITLEEARNKTIKELDQEFEKRIAEIERGVWHADKELSMTQASGEAFTYLFRAFRVMREMLVGQVCDELTRQDLMRDNRYLASSSIDKEFEDRMKQC